MYEDEKSQKRRFISKFAEYYSDFWNWIDVVPPILIIAIIIVDTLSTNEEHHPNIASYRITLQAIASFGMWIKVFYFLRIFR